MKMVTKSGTTVVALKFKDGVIIAADRKESLDLMNFESVLKIHKITDKIYYGAAGVVGDIQMLKRILQAELSLKKLKSRKEPLVEDAAHLLSTIMFSSKYFPYLTFVILVGESDEGFSIYAIDPVGGMTKSDKFISVGSGSVFALGTLESGYRENMNKDEAIQLAKKAILSAIKRDLGSGEGIDIYVLTKEGIEEYHFKIENNVIQQL